jgi:hypothetical protein
MDDRDRFPSPKTESFAADADIGAFTTALIVALLNGISSY